MNTLPYGEFVARPVTRQAIQWNGDDMVGLSEIVMWMMDNFDDEFSKHFHINRVGGFEVRVKTVHGKPGDFNTWQVVRPNDWIIRGENGEYYACDPEVFEAKYTPKEADDYHEAIVKNFLKACQRYGFDRNADPIEGGFVVPIERAYEAVEMLNLLIGLKSKPGVAFDLSNSGVGMIMAERSRQITEEGYTAERDDCYGSEGEMATAGALYALKGYWTNVPGDWPWRAEDWKPSPNNPIRNLVKAASLIAADIDRLIRLENKASDNVVKMAESIQPPLNPLEGVGGPEEPPVVPGKYETVSGEGVTVTEETKFVPANLDEAVDYLVKNCITSDANFIKANPLNKFIAGSHMGGGMAIRNGWGLWFNETPIGKFFQERGLHHGDDRSAVILKAFWCKMNDKPFSLDTEIKYYRDYWTNAGCDPDKVGADNGSQPEEGQK